MNLLDLKDKKNKSKDSLNIINFKDNVLYLEFPQLHSLQKVEGDLLKIFKNFLPTLLFCPHKSTKQEKWKNSKIFPSLLFFSLRPNIPLKEKVKLFHGQIFLMRYGKGSPPHVGWLPSNQLGLHKVFNDEIPWNTVSNIVPCPQTCMPCKNDENEVLEDTNTLWQLEYLITSH